MESGKWIRTLREDRLLKPSDVERISRSIADKKQNPDLYMPHSTLADIESGAVPSIHKLYSLALCFKVPLRELLLPFGIDAEDVAYQPEAPEQIQGMLQAAPAFRFQLNFDSRHSDQETNLLRISPKEMASLPSFFRARIDPVKYRYAVIGSRDDSMADLLPPKSIVEIDTTQTTVQTFPWRTLRDRPLYLVWHAEGHTCCWCQVDGRELTMIPHPLSTQLVRRFKMPNQASVVGRVTNAWLPFSLEQAMRD